MARNQVVVPAMLVFLALSLGLLVAVLCGSGDARAPGERDAAPLVTFVGTSAPTALAFTPDGKFLVVHEPKYMHFIETATGKHSFSYIASYPDIWDVVIDPSFSPDSTKISFRPVNGIDIKMPYYIYCDLSQPRVKFVTKLGPS